MTGIDLLCLGAWRRLQNGAYQILLIFRGGVGGKCLERLYRNLELIDLEHWKLAQTLNLDKHYSNGSSDTLEIRQVFVRPQLTMTLKWRIAAALIFLVHNAWALQVSPNSPCASTCLDTPGQNPANPNNSNTLGTDVACLDVSSNTTVVGQKFKDCMTCLQTSSAASQGENENDQGWFIYNIRYTLSSCLFGFSNVTDVVDTPCSTSTSCGPLQGALETGNLVPGSGSQYGYCLTDSDAILGQFLGKCISCLQNSGNEVFLSNFLIALQAGCIQQPPSGSIIGLDGTVFSTTPVNITFVNDNYTIKTTPKKGLSQDTIIGLAVGLGILLLITIAILFVCFRKRVNLRKIKALNSPLDSRFGAPNITSPNSGAYGNPYASPPVNASQPFDNGNITAKELFSLSGHRSVTKSQISEPKDASNWQEMQNVPPVYTPSQIPTHQAYIPTAPVDPNTVASTNPLPNYASSTNTSPYPPPSLHSIAPSRNSPQYSPATTILSSTNSSPAYIPRPPSRSQTATAPPSSTRSPPPFLSQRSPSQSITHRTPTSASLAQHSPPLVQNQRSPPPLNTTNIHARSVSRNGLGNATLASATSADIPIKISGPMTTHGRRFDFELADRERREREAREMMGGGSSHVVKKKQSWSPESEPEQWPGSY